MEAPQTAPTGHRFKCQAHTQNDTEDARVDVTVYTTALECEDEARAWCESRERWKYSTLGWELRHLDVSKL